MSYPPYPGNNPPYPGGSGGGNPPYPGGGNPPYPGGGAAGYPPGPPSSGGLGFGDTSSGYPPPAGGPGGGPAPYPGSTGGAPYPGSGGAPYPGSGGAPYPGSGGTPYPGSGGAPYPGSGGAPYPGSGGAPYPGSGGASYPGSGGAPYPGSTGGAPYSGSAGAVPYPGSTGGVPYPGSTGGAPYPGSGGGAPYSSGPSYQAPSSTGYPGHSAPHTTAVPTHASRQAQATVADTARQMGKMNISKPPPTQGTVKPAHPFDPEKDAKALRTAMKGFGTDERAIINVLAHRSNDQRQKIVVKFKALYGKDLVSDLKSELSGHFEDVVLALLVTPTKYDSQNLKSAIQGLGTDEKVLIEILCTRTNEEIAAIKQQYKKDYGRELERDVSSDTSGHFRRLLVSQLTAAREPDGPVDVGRAKQDAQALYQAGEARWGTDETKFNTILCSRSYAHLRVVFQEYAKICRYDIEQSISREMSGDLKDGMLAVVKCVRDKSAYFAERLYKSMKGLGTDDKTLVRVMVSRCEVDMVEIKRSFYKAYGKSLESFIKGDTSGDYKRILLALAGEPY